MCGDVVKTIIEHPTIATQTPKAAVHSITGFTIWDLYDHHRTVTQNLPVMRGLLNNYFEELENQVLNDPQCGIFQTLETVRQTIAGRYKEGP